ncbi:MAG: SLC13 family permease [Acidobacteriota bacterium]|nr:SLC13 family permease [Acidobacteriota bacterium]
MHTQPMFAFSVLALTVGLSLGQPRIGRYRIHHAQAGLIGAALTILLGIAPPEILLTAARLLLIPVVTIVSLMVITLVADRAGLFGELADLLARRARGRGRVLFSLLFLTGTILGTVFTNDAAVLIFTPLVFHLVERISDGGWTRENKLPFYFAVLYIANLVGGLVIANPINIVVASIFHIGFVEYARWMILPAIVSIAVSFAGLWLFFGASIPKTFPPLPPRRPSAAPRKQILCGIVLGVTLVGFFAGPAIGVPTWLIAAGGAALLCLVHGASSREGLKPIVKGVGWDVLIFLCGMFIVGLGLRQAGVTTALGDLIQQLSGGDLARMRLSTGLVAGTASAIINNHPTADMMAWVIQGFSLGGGEKRLLAFAALIGGDLGPKMLPIGSLAALMWFRLLRDKGVHIPYSLYIRVGIPVTLAAILFSLLALNLEALVVGAPAT